MFDSVSKNKYYIKPNPLVEKQSTREKLDKQVFVLLQYVSSPIGASKYSTKRLSGKGRPYATAKLLEDLYSTQ